MVNYAPFNEFTKKISQSKRAKVKAASEQKYRQPASRSKGSKQASKREGSKRAKVK